MSGHPAPESSFSIPEKEPARQIYFMDLAAELVRERAEKLGRPCTSCVVTFGCQMNERDSEKLRGILLRIGYLPAEEEEADLVIYNTCTVREHADTRIMGRLGSLRPRKKKNPDIKIAVCGCMAQEAQTAQKILEENEHLDLLFGTHNLYRLAEYLVRLLSGEKKIVEVLSERDQVVENLPTSRTWPFKAGVNIMIGCNNFCSYCIVPYVRGREISRASGDILDEIKSLADEGVQEVMLLGQNVNSYGNGTDGEIRFPELLARVAETGIPRIRFMTSHPKDLSGELIDVMTAHKNICRHLHLPLQSGSNAVLAAMNRRYTREHYLHIVHRLREAIPELSLTTDLIVGFPGETEEDHEQTMDLIEQVRFDSAFTFQYSRRAGTPAAKMSNQIPDDVVKRRFDALLARVQEIGRERTGRFLGQTKEVLVESVNARDASLLTGRTENNAVVHFPGKKEWIGRFVPVLLTECLGFYYIGKRE